MMASTSALVPSGSAAFRSAPVSASARAAAVAPWRAAYMSGVQPPRGSTVKRADLPSPYFAQRELQRIRPGVDVGAVLREQRDRVRVILRRGPDERRLAQDLLARVHVDVARQQDVHRVGVPAARRDHEHRLAVRHRRGRIRARLDERVHHGGVPVERGEGQRRDAVPVGLVRARAGVEQQTRGLEVVRPGPTSAAPSCRRPRAR